jgi:hypothetical protein
VPDLCIVQGCLLCVCLTIYHITLLLIFVIQVLNSTFTLILIRTGVAVATRTQGGRPQASLWPRHSSGGIHGGRIHCLLLLYTGCGVYQSTAEGLSPLLSRSTTAQPISLPRTPFTTSGPSILISSTTVSRTYMVSSRTVQLIDVPTEDQRADFLTKALRGDVFWRHVRAVWLVRWYGFGD